MKSIKLNYAEITKTKESVYFLIDVDLHTAMLNFDKSVINYLLYNIDWLLNKFSIKILHEIQVIFTSMDRIKI